MMQQSKNSLVLFFVIILFMPLCLAQGNLNLTINSQPTTPNVTPPRGGGGVGEGAIDNFILNKDLIKVVIKQGETHRETLEIVNAGDSDIIIEVWADYIQKFVAISEDSFVLKAGEKKILNLDFTAREDEIPDSYIGKIIVKSGNVIKPVNVIVDVKEKKPLFDVQTEVIDKIIQQNSKVMARIKIINMGDLNNLDILLYIAVKDAEGNVLLSKEESLAINKELNIVRDIRIGNFSDGKYVFYVRASYGNISASGSDFFEVSRINIPKIIFYPIAITIFVIMFIIILFLVLRKKKMEGKEPKIKEQMKHKKLGIDAGLGQVEGPKRDAEQAEKLEVEKKEVKSDKDNAGLYL